MASVPRHPITGDDEQAWIGGASEPGTETLSDVRPLAAWPRSILGRIWYARRLRGAGPTQAEQDYLQRRATIAAARDAGAHADVLADEDGVLIIDPPHRGVGRARLQRRLEGGLVRALSNAITRTVCATEAVT